jgi:hypothetical protein
MGLDGKTLLDEEGLKREALQLYHVMQMMNVRVDGLGPNLSNVLNLHIPMTGLSSAARSIGCRDIPLTSNVKYTFLRGSESGLEVRIREYEKSPRDGSVNLLIEDIQFASL